LKRVMAFGFILLERVVIDAKTFHNDITLL